MSLPFNYVSPAPTSVRKFVVKEIADASVLVKKSGEPAQMLSSTCSERSASSSASVVNFYVYWSRAVTTGFSGVLCLYRKQGSMIDAVRPLFSAL